MKKLKESLQNFYDVAIKRKKQLDDQLLSIENKFIINNNLYVSRIDQISDIRLWRNYIRLFFDLPQVKQIKKDKGKIVQETTNYENQIIDFLFSIESPLISDCTSSFNTKRSFFKKKEILAAFLEME